MNIIMNDNIIMNAKKEKILYMSEQSLNVTLAGISQCRFRKAGVM